MCVLFLRGVPHAHICAFLHEDDKLAGNIDKIDQLMWAEIPIDCNSAESASFLKKYRNVDNHRTHRWKSTDEVPYKIHTKSFKKVLNCKNI